MVSARVGGIETQLPVGTRRKAAVYPRNVASHRRVGPPPDGFAETFTAGVEQELAARRAPYRTSIDDRCKHFRESCLERLSRVLAFHE